MIAKTETTWRKVKLREVMTTARVNFEKVKTSEYKRNGLLPIFDQGSDAIAGYTDDPKAEYKGKSPAILFGDHTLKLKIAESPFAIGADGIQILEPNENLLDRKFFYYALKGLKMRSYGYERHMKYLRELEIAHPNITDQKRIADILSAFDEKIENNNRIVKTLEEMAQAIFKEWFVNPAGRETLLLELATFVNGGAFGSIINRNGHGVPLIKIAELNKGITDNTEWIDQPVADKYCINDGDLLFSWSGTVDIFIWATGQAVLNQHIFNVVPKGNYSRGLVYYVLKSKLPFFKQMAGAKATTMGHIKKEHLEEQSVVIPRHRNLGVFDDFYKKIILLQLENKKLASLRDLLLPKLMSGVLDIN
ncbi:MAG TPA: restriction endonuclease subunit S [Candidatus Paceibacterota bacterium]